MTPSVRWIISRNRLTVKHDLYFLGGVQVRLHDAPPIWEQNLALDLLPGNLPQFVVRATDDAPSRRGRITGIVSSSRKGMFELLIHHPSGKNLLPTPLFADPHLARKLRPGLGLKAEFFASNGVLYLYDILDLYDPQGVTKHEDTHANHRTHPSPHRSPSPDRVQRGGVVAGR